MDIIVMAVTKIEKGLDIAKIWRKKSA